MRMIHLADGTAVTTPIYAGAPAAVIKMQACLHVWTDIPGTQMPTPVDTDGTGTMVMQTCASCGAARGRCVPAPGKKLPPPDERDYTLTSCGVPVVEMPPAETWFCWRLYAHVEGCEDEGKRLLVYVDDSNGEPEPFDNLYKTVGEALKDKVHSGAPQRLMLCRMTLEPVDPLSAMVAEPAMPEEPPCPGST